MKHPLTLELPEESIALCEQWRREREAQPPSRLKATASPRRSLPQKSSSPTTKLGEPKIPSSRARSPCNGPSRRHWRRYESGWSPRASTQRPCP